MLLAIDTSIGTSVAVVNSTGSKIAEFNSNDPMRHAEAIGVLIKAALSASKITASQLTGVAVGIGPGPFTGLRVGIAAAKVFALARGCTLHPIASHDAVAALNNGAVQVVTDARRGEVAVSSFSGLDVNALPVLLNAVTLYKKDEIPLVPAARVYATAVSAAMIGFIAIRRQQLGLPVNPPTPIYLRQPDVTVSAAMQTTMAWGS